MLSLIPEIVININFLRLLGLITVFLFASGCPLAAVDYDKEKASQKQEFSNLLIEDSLLSYPQPSSFTIPQPANINATKEMAFQARRLAIREKLAAINLDEKDAWWRRIKLGDPHKYLLPIIAVIFQLILNETDLKAGVPPVSYLVLPQQ